MALRRTALKRKTPLRSKVRLAVHHAIGAFRSTTSHARRERSPAFMGWTVRQTCMVRRFVDELHRAAGARQPVPAEYLRCDGPVQADHAGNRFTDGNGKRAFDRTVIPMCRRHHEHRTNAGGTRSQAGIFYGFTCEMVRVWSNRAIEIHQRCAQLAGVEIPAC